MLVAHPVASCWGRRMFKLCVVIPVYNHGQPLIAVVARLRELQLPCLLVDDGSQTETAMIIDELAQQAEVNCLRLEINQGKGAAVMAGLRKALELGFTHALQMDADGQHDLQAVPGFIAAAQRAPEQLVCGYPEYDASVPKGRLYARYLTHVWVWVHTLSFSIRDSMCGFRVYPLAPALQLFDQVKLGTRMDFDTEVLVRLYWRGLVMQWLPVKVIYPEGGLSNFRALADNLLITKMHTQLFFGMVWRSPYLLARRLFK